MSKSNFARIAARESKYDNDSDGEWAEYQAQGDYLASLELADDPELDFFIPFDQKDNEPDMVSDSESEEGSTASSDVYVGLSDMFFRADLESMTPIPDQINSYEWDTRQLGLALWDRDCLDTKSESTNTESEDLGEMFGSASGGAESDDLSEPEIVTVPEDAVLLELEDMCKAFGPYFLAYFEKQYDRLTEKLTEKKVPKWAKEIGVSSQLELLRLLKQRLSQNQERLSNILTLKLWIDGVFGTSASVEFSSKLENKVPTHLTLRTHKDDKFMFRITKEQIIDFLARESFLVKKDSQIVKLSIDKSMIVHKALRTLFESYGYEITSNLESSLLVFQQRVAVLYLFGLAEKYLKWVFACSFCFFTNQSEFPKTPSFMCGTFIPGVFLSGAGYMIQQKVKRQILLTNDFQSYSFALSCLMLKYGCPYPDETFLDEGIKDHFKSVCRDLVEDRTLESLKKYFPRIDYTQVQVTAMPAQKDQDIRKVIHFIKHNPVLKKGMKVSHPDGYDEFMTYGLSNAWDYKAGDPINTADDTYAVGPLETLRIQRYVDRPVNQCRPRQVAPSCSSHSITEQGFELALQCGIDLPEEMYDSQKLTIRHGGSFFFISSLLSHFYLRHYESCFYTNPDGAKQALSWDEECISYTLKDWELEFGRLYESDWVTPYQVVKPLLTRPVPLPEELKVRVITLGPSNEYHSMMDIQRLVHGYLRTREAYTLIGEPVTSSLIERTFPNVPAKSFFVSGDYKAATDNLQPELSLVCADQLSKMFGLNEDQRNLFFYGLCGHQIDYDNLLSGSCPSSLEAADWVTGTKLQTHGQLMGSPVSFPVLCMANDACLRASFSEYLSWYEDFPCLRGEEDSPAFYEYSKGVLRGKGYLINGDDILFLGVPKLYEIWNRIVRSCGLEPSVGKNYTSPLFCIVNSTLFLFQRSEVIDTSGTFIQVPWLNQSLLNNGVREKPVILSFTNDPTVKSISSNGWEFLKGIPRHLILGDTTWEDHWNSLYIRSWSPYIKENVPEGLPWFVSCQNGGLGLPITRDCALTPNQVKYVEYFSQTQTHILSTAAYDRVKDAGVQAFVPSEVLEDIGVLDELPFDGGRNEILREGYKSLYVWLQTGLEEGRSFWGSLQGKYREKWYKSLPEAVQQYELGQATKMLQRIQKMHDEGDVGWAKFLRNYPTALSYLIDRVPTFGRVLEKDSVRLDEQVTKKVRQRFMRQFPEIWNRAQRHTIKRKELKDLTYDDQQKLYKIKNKNGRVCKIMWSIPIR
jgi:hypothetical protein